MTFLLEFCFSFNVFRNLVLSKTKAMKKTLRFYPKHLFSGRCMGLFYFDKPNAQFYLDNPSNAFTEHSIEEQLKTFSLDITDVPLSSSYLDELV